MPLYTSTSIYLVNRKMTSSSSSRIGIRRSDGSISDTSLHEEIMEGVDDTPLRLMSAKRAIADLGLTQEEAEATFNVKLPDDVGVNSH